MAILIGAGMRIGPGIAISSGEPITPTPIESLEGDYQILTGATIDLMLLSGSEDLNA
jgi:hypothetical protein